jgi:hypothetical protein
MTDHHAIPYALPVRFYKQGGHPCDGLAIGRKGSTILIRYHITNGEARERWLPAKRIIELGGDIDSLPRYRTKTCKTKTGA